MSRDCELNEIEYISIKPRGICIYKKNLNRSSRFVDVSEYIENTSTNSNTPLFKKPNQKMSQRAVQRMKLAIQWLLYLSINKKQYSRDLKKWIPFRINFITLTLCSEQIHSDNEIKSKLLHQFLVEMKTGTGMKNYVWRAEKQRNGNIHFHIVTDTWIDHRALRAKWNRIQNKLGYVDRYAEKQRREIKSFTDYYNKYLGMSDYMTLLRRYNENLHTKWKTPNSTDVHSIKRIKNIEAYLTKYMCKEAFNKEEIDEKSNDKMNVEGKLWGLSEGLSKLKNASSILTASIVDELNLLFKRLRYRVFNADFYQYLNISLKDIYRYNCNNLIEIVENKLIEVGYRELKAT